MCAKIIKIREIKYFITKKGLFLNKKYNFAPKIKHIIKL